MFLVSGQLEPELDFDREVYPLGLSPAAGIIVGISQRLTLSTCSSMPCFEPTPQAQPILPCLLWNLLQVCVTSRHPLDSEFQYWKISRIGCPWGDKIFKQEGCGAKKRMSIFLVEDLTQVAPSICSAINWKRQFNLQGSQKGCHTFLILWSGYCSLYLMQLCQGIHHLCACQCRNEQSYLVLG